MFHVKHFVLRFGFADDGCFADGSADLENAIVVFTDGL